MDYTLLAPGPTPLPPSVSKKLAEPMIHHRTKAFSEMFVSCLEKLKTVYRTKNDVLMVTASGSAGMESAVANLLSPGDKALVCVTGIFGERFLKILRAYGLDPVVISAEKGRALDPDKLRNQLLMFPDLKAVFLQHTDTSTGIVNDIAGISEVIRDNSDALIVVDAISGLAAEELETDAWDLDVVIAGSQKGLMAPPGLSFFSVSENAWKAVAEAKLPRFYFDWTAMRCAAEKGQSPYTPAVNIILAQEEALRLITEEGLENIWKRTADLASFTRSEVEKRGWTLFAKNPADILTGIVMPDGVDGQALVQSILAEDNISIAGGQAELSGKIVRIAHMGYIQKADVERGLAALDKRL